MDQEASEKWAVEGMESTVDRKKYRNPVHGIPPSSQRVEWAVEL